MEPTNDAPQPQGEDRVLLPPGAYDPERYRVKYRANKKYILSGFLAGVIIAVAGICLYVLRRQVTPSKSNTPVATQISPSVTLFYNDGKTVLWETKTPAKADTDLPDKAPDFVYAVRDELRKTYGETYYMQGAWEVTTTLDAVLQKHAEDAIAAQQAELTKRHVTSTTFIAEENSTGKVVSWVGDAAMSIQPGGTIKPFVYAAQIEHSTNTGAGTKVDDTQGPLDGYPCTNRNQPNVGGNCLWNYDWVYAGSMSLRYALGLQRNVPAVKSLISVGVPTFMDTVKDLGVEHGYSCYADATKSEKATCYQASGLGDGAYLRFADEVHAYGTLSNNGLKLPQTIISKTILNGSTKSEWKLSEGSRAVRPETAYIISDILSDKNASYLTGSLKDNFTAGSAKLGLALGVTNTADASNVVGFSSKYTAGFWAGNTENKSLTTVMEVPVLSTWHSWMVAANNDPAFPERTKPAGLQTLNAYILKTKVTRLGEVVPSPTTDLYPSWYKE